MKFGVSFYSYQDAFRTGKLDLEGCVAEVAKLGADGIELLPTQTPPCSYPKAEPAEIDAWHALMAKYGTRPVCLDSVIVVRSEVMGMKGLQGPHVGANLDEQIQLLRDEILLCHQLGFRFMRSPMLYGFDFPAIEAALPYAEQMDVNLGLEIHVPLQITGPEVAHYIDFIQRTGTKHASLIPDMAIFSRTLPVKLVEATLRAGADAGTVQQIVGAFEARQDMAALAETLRSDGRAEKCEALLGFAVRNVTSRPEELRQIYPYISHFHAKFYDVDEKLVEHGIAFDEVIPILQELGYEGYMNSEFEGQRIGDVSDPLDEVEQVRRQHAMIRAMLQV